MPRPTIEYLNARHAALPASGGTNYRVRETAECCPDRDLDLWERTDLQIDSAWSDYRINAEAMWDQIYARFDIDRDDDQSTGDAIPF